MELSCFLFGAFQVTKHQFLDHAILIRILYLPFIDLQIAVIYYERFTDLIGLAQFGEASVSQAATRVK